MQGVDTQCSTAGDRRSKQLQPTVFDAAVEKNALVDGGNDGGRPGRRHNARGRIVVEAGPLGRAHIELKTSGPFVHSLDADQ